MSTQEAAIYLSLLHFEAATVAEIAHDTGINRVTCYDILERMVRKQYVANVSGKKKKFTAINPSILSMQMNMRWKQFEDIVPKLSTIMQHEYKPHIEFYEGIEAIKTIYADTLTSSTEILNFSNSSIIRKYWSEYDEEYVYKRIKKKIYLRGIIPDDETGNWVQDRDDDSHREFRMVSQDEFTFENEINIYDDKVAITSFEDTLHGVIIRSKAMAKTQRDIFKMAWSFAK